MSEIAPKVVNYRDVQPTSSPVAAGAKVYKLITSEIARNHVLTLFVCEPGVGTDWHIHPAEVTPGVPEEDLFYVVRGKGTIHYMKEGKEYTVEISEGDAIYSGHCRIKTLNTGSEPLVLVATIAPPRKGID